MQRTAALIALLAAQLVGAPPPKLLREIELSQIIPARPGYMPSTNFAFSPDEKWLVVTFGVHPIDPRERSKNIGQPGSERMLLVPVNGPADQQVQFDPGLRPMGNPGWSPDSDAFFVQGLAPARNLSKGGILKVWNLRGEELFHRGGWSWMDVVMPGGIPGFIDPEHLLVRTIPAKKTPSTFEILDLEGRVVSTWSAPKHWSIRDISLDRHLFAVFSDDRAPQTLVVDYPSKKVVLTKDNPYGRPLGSGGSWQFFTEDGKTLCSVGSVQNQPTPKDTYTECWDVDSGKKVAQFEGFLGGAPAAASTHGSRLVLTNNLLFTRKKVESIVTSYGERIVWDFRSGTEVAAWNMPEFLWTNAFHSIELPSPTPVAISSTGRYVAEADGVRLRIYELP